MSVSECCKTGFSWGGSPTGTETTIANNKTYVTGSSKSAAILIIHDIFGWTFTNLRLLADHYAKEADATVYVVDFFGGEVVPEDTMTDPKKREAFDFMSFIGRNSKEIRYPEMTSVAKTLKSQYPKVGAIGFCYGGWAVFRLAADPSLIDAVSTAHPSVLENAEIDGAKVPVQILSPETDPQYTPELKEYSLKVLPTLGIPFEYVYFPKLMHGFATKGDQNDKLQKDGLERAKRSAVNFFNEFLH